MHLYFLPFDWSVIETGHKIIKNRMLNSAEHKTLNAHKDEDIKKLSMCQA